MPFLVIISNILYEFHERRLLTFEKLIAQNITVIGMPQSFHYKDSRLAVEDARYLTSVIKDKLGAEQAKRQIIFTWRQQNSYSTLKNEGNKIAFALYNLLESCKTRDLQHS